MRFYLVSVHGGGYKARAAFSAETVEAAARIHVDAYRSMRRVSSALVLRHADGKRWSVWDSEQAIRAAA